MNKSYKRWEEHERVGFIKMTKKQLRPPYEAAQKIHMTPKSCDINSDCLSKDSLPIQVPSPM